MTSHLGKLALKYASQGFHVFPLQPGTKIPLKGSRGLNDATIDREQIEKWWQEIPEANIGMRTGEISGLTVVDYDRKSDGVETFYSWGGEGDTGVGETYRVSTAGGGYHEYYAYDKDLKQTAGLAKGVDVRNDGGYVVGPGSRVSGVEYAVTYSAAGIRPVPDFIKEKQKRPYEKKAIGGATDPNAVRGGSGAGGSIFEGGRNDALTVIAGALRRHNLTDAGLMRALSSINETECHPPLPEHEVSTIAWSIGKKDPAKVPAYVPLDCVDLLPSMGVYLKDKKKVVGVPTGLIGLDKLLLGYRNGEVTALNARAKTGKSTLIHKLIHLLVSRGTPVGYASREMYPDKEVLPSLLSIELQRNVRMEDPDEHMPEYVRAVKNWKIKFTSGYGVFPLKEIEIWIKNMRAEFGIELFFFDHLHYMAEDSEDYKTVANLAREIKRIAMEQDVHIFLVVQPPKVSEEQKLGIDTMRGGAGVGQAISSVLTLERTKDPHGALVEDTTTLTLDSHRCPLARTGKIHLEYHRETNDLKEITLEVNKAAIESPRQFDSEGMQIE